MKKKDIPWSLDKGIYPKPLKGKDYVNIPINSQYGRFLVTPVDVGYIPNDKIKMIDILNMLSNGHKLPKIIEYEGVQYKNMSRTGLTMLYSSNKKDDFNLVLLLDQKITDADFLNSAVKIIEF